MEPTRLSQLYHFRPVFRFLLYSKGPIFLKMLSRRPLII